MASALLAPRMKHTAIVLLQAVLVALAICVLAGLLWEPIVEGVNANATTLYEIYFDDPFLAYIYVSFIAVFVGLYQAFKLLGYIGRDETYSQKSVRSLRTIQYCAMSFAGLIFLAVVYIFAGRNNSDDIAGGVAVGLFLIVASGVIATVAAWVARLLSKRVHVP